MNNDSKNSIPIIPVSDVPSRPLNDDNEIFQNSKDGFNMLPSKSLRSESSASQPRPSPTSA